MTSNINQQQVEADRVTAASPVSIGSNSIIRAEDVTIGKNVRIGDNVEIICDRLELGDGCSIGSGTVILCPEIQCEEGCSLGESVRAELNDHLRVGRRSVIGRNGTFTGRGVESGEFLWMKNDVIVGGGGAQGPRSYLKIGSRCTIIDKCYINLAEEVSIGDSTALSYNVALLTHSAWQPSLLGFPTKFAPVRVGNYCVIYLNSVILPGVTIGDYSAIGACSLVTRNVASHSLAAGNPAKVVRGNGHYPGPFDRGRVDSLIKSILVDYAATLEPKGVRVINSLEPGKQYVTLVFAEQRQTIGYFTETQPLKMNGKADITVSFGATPQESIGQCHFNLKEETITGELTPIGEDLRDYLRRRAVRLFTDKPFQTLPLANLERMKARKKRK